MKCGCGVNQIETGYSIICSNCGLETAIFNNELMKPSYNQSYGVLHTSTYSRKYRFKTLFCKTVMLHSGPRSNDPICLHLEQQKHTFKTVKDIQIALSKTPFKNKRYDCLSIFAHIFLPKVYNHKRVSRKQARQAQHLFDTVETKWRSCRVTRFFSYFWILEKILIKIGAAYCMETSKRLICKQRRAFYNEMLSKLGDFSTQPLCVKEKCDFSEWMSLRCAQAHSQSTPRQTSPVPIGNLSQAHV